MAICMSAATCGHRRKHNSGELLSRSARSVGFANVGRCSDKMNPQSQKRKLAPQTPPIERIKSGSCNVSAAVSVGAYRSDIADTLRNINIQLRFGALLMFGPRSHIAEILDTQHTRHLGMRYAVQEVGVANPAICGYRLDRRPRWRKLSLKSVSTKRPELERRTVLAILPVEISRDNKGRISRLPRRSVAPHVAFMERPTFEAAMVVR